MAARKKKTTRKKTPVKEASYKVTKSRSDAGGSQVDDDTIDAANSAEATEKAMKDDPRAGTYDEVTVKKDNGGGGRVRTKSDSVSAVKPRTEPQTGFESLDYPYGIGLPMGFKALFEALPKKVTESLKFGSRYGRLHIEVPDSGIMSKLVTEMEKKARGKTAVKSLAERVVTGINESVKK